MQSMLTRDVLDFAQLIRFRVLADRQWDLAASSYPRMDERGRKETLAGIKREAYPRAKSVFELVPDDVRVQMIGLEMRLHGQPWADSHPDHIAWLHRNGYTVEEAIEIEQNAHQWAFEDDFFSGKASKSTVGLGGHVGNTGLLPGFAGL